MKKIFLAVFAVVVALGLTVDEAEAARFGGGRSFGMQRQSVAPKPTRQATPAAPTAPAGAPAVAPKRNWMGPIAGLAAGLGIAALLSHFGMGEGMANFVMIVLLAMAAVFIIKMLFRRNLPSPRSEPMQYAGAGRAPGTPVAQVSPLSAGAGAPAAASASIPAGFDVESFLRVAKLNFVRLQAANDAKNLEDIREFVSPEIYAEIKMQMDERGSVTQRTDVVTLNADLLEVTTEGNRHVASVHFSGMIRETAESQALPFEEVWNLSKPVDGSRGWVVSGIQQIN